MKRNMMLAIAVVLAALPAPAGEEAKREGEKNDAVLTVYPSFAVVRERRAVQTGKGAQRLVFDEVPPSAQATSLRFVWPKEAGVEVVEQNLEYDLVNPSALFKKYLGRAIELSLKDGRSLKGSLLYFDESAFILRPAGAEGALSLVARFENVREVRFPDPPRDLLLRPSLVCRIEAGKAGRTGCDLTYVAANFTWRADYVAVLDAEDKTFELSAWVSLNNTSGTTYAARRLRLATESGEHFYDVPRPTELRHNQLKQVRLFPTVTGVRVEKDFAVRLRDAGLSEDKLPVEVCLRFPNAKENRLGFALPAGKVRVLKADRDGTLEFVGEGMLGHVPPDEEAVLAVGHAFDLVAEQKCAAIRHPAATLTEYDEALVLRNHKEKPARVRLIIYLNADQALLTPPAGLRPEKQDARHWEGQIEVPPGREGLTVRYTVRKTTR